MIRPFTCVCALLAGASGLYLYSEKHQTTLLDQQISKIVSDTQHTRERTAMLRAEWALLNQPDRLQGLATRFLPQLQAMAPTQFVQLASLEKRLPAVGPETPPQPILTPATAPGLVGLKPDAVPVAEGMAIAQTDTHPAATRLAATATTRGPAAHDTAPRHEVQLADADTGTEAEAAPTVVPQPVLRRVAARVIVRDVVSHHATIHASSPVHAAVYAEAIVPRARPLVTTVSSYNRPQVITGPAWRPVAHAGWSAPRQVAYAGPAVGASIGSSLGGGGRAALPAPVPLSDSN